MAITQDSINIRLQKLICCIGTLGGEIQGMIAVGNECYKEKLKHLKILVGYLDALKCYNVTEETNAVATFTFLGDPGSGTGSIEFFVNGVSISGIYNVTTGTLLQNNQWLADQINNYSTDYIAEVVDGIINITGDCHNHTLDFTDTNRTGWGTMSTNFTGGNCIDNCLTETQVLTMFDKVSEYCDICFPNAEYNFTNSVTE